MPGRGHGGGGSPGNGHAILLVVLDGLGDRPSPQLEGKTPLEAAATPNLDRAAADGLTGLVDPLRPGVPVGTQTGTGVLLGLSPGEVARLSRGPVEAAGVGLTLRPGDVALRCNFATLEANGDGFRVVDRRAGRIREGTEALAEAVNALADLRGVAATLVPAAQHRAVLRLSGMGLSAEISDTDPRRAGRSLLRSQALRSGEPSSVRTATALNDLLREVIAVLDDHPVNRARRAQGLAAANGLLTRGAGAPTPVAGLLQQLGVSGAVVAGDRTVLGLAALCGLTGIASPGFTCLPDTDLEGKVAAADEALESHGFVSLHIKAPDILAHDCDPEGKRDLIERIDAALGPLLARDDIALGVTADHTTNSQTGRHTGDPVPALLRAPGGRTDRVTTFGEQDCIVGGLGRLRAHAYFRCLADAAGLMPAFSRPEGPGAWPYQP